ncbi:hypothetical protein RJ641_030677, partial [Dillenia turbinata]
EKDKKSALEAEKTLQNVSCNGFLDQWFLDLMQWFLDLMVSYHFGFLDLMQWFLVFLFLCLSFFLCVDSPCDQELTIFVFGDSNSDTGAYEAGTGLITRPPSGMTFFHHSVGRFCDGQLSRAVVKQYFRIVCEIFVKTRRIRAEQWACGFMSGLTRSIRKQGASETENGNRSAVHLHNGEAPRFPWDTGGPLSGTGPSISLPAMEDWEIETNYSAKASQRIL